MKLKSINLSLLVASFLSLSIASSGSQAFGVPADDNGSDVVSVSPEHEADEIADELESSMEDAELPAIAGYEVRDIEIPEGGRDIEVEFAIPRGCAVSDASVNCDFGDLQAEAGVYSQSGARYPTELIVESDRYVVKISAHEVHAQEVIVGLFVAEKDGNRLEELAADTLEWMLSED